MLKTIINLFGKKKTDRKEKSLKKAVKSSRDGNQEGAGLLLWEWVGLYSCKWREDWKAAKSFPLDTMLNHQLQTGVHQSQSLEGIIMSLNTPTPGDTYCRVDVKVILMTKNRKNRKSIMGIVQHVCNCG